MESTEWSPLDVLHPVAIRDAGGLHSVDGAGPRHHSQALECRTRDRARASRRAAALPIRLCRERGRREFRAARRRLAASWCRFRCLRSSSFFTAFDFGVRDRFQIGCQPVSR